MPSAGAYAPAVQTIDVLRGLLARYGITAQEDIDLYVALVGGLADGQLRQRPGWRALVPSARP